MSAVRLARAATGRTKLLKFAGAYHGHTDALLAEAGSGVATQGIPASPGRAGRGHGGDLRRAVERRGGGARRGRRARARGDPGRADPGQHGPRPAGRRLLSTLLRGRATRTARCSSSTRSSPASAWRPGGAQELAGVTPDLTILGKIIGGGLPAAAYGGRRELMERIAPAGDVYQAGTLSGNPLAVAAGLATLRLLDDAAYHRLADDHGRARRGHARGRGRGRRARSRCTTARGSSPCSSPRRRSRDYAERGGRRRRGPRRLVPRAARPRRLPAALAFEAWFPSLAHSPEHVARTLDAAAAAFASARVSAARPPRRGRSGPRAACSPTRIARPRPGRRAPCSARPPPRGRAPRGREADYALRRRGDPRGLPAALRPPAGASPRSDPDLALLAGDRLYALGLARLADARRHRGRGRARRRHRARRLGPGRRTTAGWPARPGGPAPRRSAAAPPPHTPRPRTPAAAGARRRGGRPRRRTARFA